MNLDDHSGEKKPSGRVVSSQGLTDGAWGQSPGQRSLPTSQINTSLVGSAVWPQHRPPGPTPGLHDGQRFPPARPPTDRPTSSSVTNTALSGSGAARRRTNACPLFLFFFFFFLLSVLSACSASPSCEGELAGAAGSERAARQLWPTRPPSLLSGSNGEGR